MLTSGIINLAEFTWVFLDSHSRLLCSNIYLAQVKGDSCSLNLKFECKRYGTLPTSVGLVLVLC